MERVQVYGFTETIKELELLPGKLINTARSDLRVAVEPMKASISSYIPSAPPLMGRQFDRNGGMNHKGRTGWNKAAIKITVKTSFSKRTQRNQSSLVSVWVGGKKGTYGAAGLQIADMAGRRNKVKTGGRTRDYAYKGGTRSHAINGQGASMIDKLQGKPSRYVWRAAMLHMNTVQNSVLQSLDKVSKQVNKNLVVK
jgi:hypothetical protein